MITARARIRIHDGCISVIPIVVPGLEEVRAFAAKLHAAGQSWTGEAFGWPAEYNAERSEAPLDSKMPFTPADFCIGESGVWFYEAELEEPPHVHVGNAGREAKYWMALLPWRSQSGFESTI